MTDPWQSYPTDLSPIAPSIGPFADRAFLATSWDHRDGTDADLVIEANEEGAVALVVAERGITFAGQSNLTDYHSPLGAQGANLLAKTLARFPGAVFSLDSLPIEAATNVQTALEHAGYATSLRQHEVTAVLELPATYDDWLASIGKKERHEVRRKRRRFESEFGEIEVTEHGLESIDLFCAMHRASHGDKGMFMTGPMQDYFADLITRAGARIHTLTCDGIPRANAFGFERDDGYYYYNSAYDMDAAMASPGIVLLASIIETQIDRGARIFDMLKGDERYKFKHGAEPRPLFAVEGTVA